MTPKRSNDLRLGDFFVFRTPLLPFEELEAWNLGLVAPNATPGKDHPTALESDRALLRQRLERFIARPEIREALFLASSSLESGLEAWRRDPESKKGQKAEQALVRYIYRMTTRATPFGLFAGCSLGKPGERTRLRLTRRKTYRRHSRLDMDYLDALCVELGKNPEVRRHLPFRPNSSLYVSAGRLRYVETRRQGKKNRHHLVAVDADEVLVEILHQASEGATPEELSRSLAQREEVPPEDAAAFVDELIDHQILVSDLAPPVTGREPVHTLVEQFSRHSNTQSVATCLRSFEAQLKALDDGGLGQDPRVYGSLAEQLETLPIEANPSRLLQVDMIKPAAEATLGPALVAEIERGVQLLRRLVGPRGPSPLDRFRERFQARYAGRQRIPLVEVLDEEAGLGFEGSGPSNTPSPLLEGLDFSRPSGGFSAAWGPKEEMLLEKLLAAQATGSRQIEIREEDLGRLPSYGLPEIPNAFHVTAMVGESFEEGSGASQRQIFLRSVGGPSGVNLLGRFCHADEEIHQKVEQHLREEERHDPESIYAEIVHLPQGRLGNVLLRPVLRSHEITFLGRSGASQDHQIPITDLLVSSEARQIVLHSQKFGRRVIPRLTSAHNFNYQTLGIYRFLGLLQGQAGLRWNWGPFGAAPFLPRVTSGPLVLARARWLVSKREIQRWTSRDSADRRFEAVQKWRSSRQLPPRVIVVDGDNELLIEFDNALSVETFIALAKSQQQLILFEFFPSPDRLCAEGPEGRFTHELILPFTRRPPRKAQEAETDRETSPALTAETPRTFLPGSEWLYLKLYTGQSTADQLLTDLVGPLVREAMASGAVDRWFFLRFGDPDFHLRLRLHGDPDRLLHEVLPRFQGKAKSLLDDGRLWRLQLESYDRELERYGQGGIDLAERFFWIDSEAVLRLVETFQGDEDAESRWLLTARGIDRLFSDLGYHGARKLEILESLQESYFREFGRSTHLRKQLADRLRRERRRLEDVLEPIQDVDHPLASGFQALDQRSQRLAPIVDDIRAAEKEGRLGAPLDPMARSLVHMFTNRILRAEGRAHELVLYDFLLQCARSRVARERSARKRAPSHGPKASSGKPSQPPTPTADLANKAQAVRALGG